MVKAAFGFDQRVAEWVAEQLFPGRDFGRCKAIGWTDEHNGLIAGTVFHNWEPAAGVIELSSAAIDSRWLTRRVINEMFGYVFETCGCQLAVMRVSVRNKRMCSIARRFGFTGTLIRRLRGKDEDETIFTLTVEEWMAHPMRNAPDGKAHRADAA